MQVHFHRAFVNKGLGGLRVFLLRPAKKGRTDMAAMNKIRVMVAGVEYTLMSADPPELSLIHI